MIRKLLIALGTVTSIFVVASVVFGITGLYNQTIRIVDSTGNVIGGVASAVVANYNQTVRVVDSNGNVIDSFAGPTPAATQTPTATPTPGGTGSQVIANTVPNVVTVGAADVIGAGGTFTIAPPASIVNGNTLWAIMAVRGQSTETWTPASGFTQVGSNLASTASGKTLLAVFCKVAASESGNYVFTFNNGTSGIGVAVVAQIGGTTCTPDVAALTQTGNAATITVASGSVTTANDLLLAIGSQTGAGGTGTVAITSPGNYTSQFANNALSVLTLANGGTGATPATVFNAYTTTAQSNDFVGLVLPLAPTTNASAQPVTNGAAQNGTVENYSGPVDFTGTIQANAGINLPSNNISASSTAKSLNAYTSYGKLAPLLSLNSANNLAIDGANLVTRLGLGNSISTGGVTPVMAPGTDVGYGFWTPDGGTEDVPGMALDSSGNLDLGCLGCSDANSQYKDMKFGIKTSQTFHWLVNNADIATLAAAAFKVIGGAAIQSTGGTLPTMTTGCGAGNANAGSTNNRGSFTTGTTETTCTLTFSASGAWGQAPFCVCDDANASITPLACSVGAISTATVVFDFASATTKTFRYICM